MDTITIDGILLTELKRIPHRQGDIFHAIKKTDAGFMGFGEAYFSTIRFNEIKAWKKHSKMTLNLIVPVGRIKFVLYDDRQESRTKGLFYEVILSPENYKRLTVTPDIWMGFQGLDEGLSLLLNIANLEHDPDEIDRRDLYDPSIPYVWGGKHK